MHKSIEHLAQIWHFHDCLRLSSVNRHLSWNYIDWMDPLNKSPTVYCWGHSVSFRQSQRWSIGSMRHEFLRSHFLHYTASSRGMPAFCSLPAPGHHQLTLPVDPSPWYHCCMTSFIADQRKRQFCSNKKKTINEWTNSLQSIKLRGWFGTFHQGYHYPWRLPWMYSGLSLNGEIELSGRKVLLIRIRFV